VLGNELTTEICHSGILPFWGLHVSVAANARSGADLYSKCTVDGVRHVHESGMIRAQMVSTVDQKMVAIAWDD
jgi:hypothetical protein